MIALIVGMLVCIGLAVVVVGLVAIPARREGRELLTPRGEEMVAMVRERTESAVDTTISRTGDLMGSVGRDRESGPAAAGASDAGASDAGASDAGASDAGASDAGVSGAGVSGAGRPDAGPSATAGAKAS